MRRGIATFTLDHGRCPPWLFERMVKLGRAMTEVLVEEYGPDEFVRRIADPVWFQSLGTVLAFDWNASGLTTVLTGALKEAIRGQEKDLGIFISGGKGATSRKTPDQITDWGARLNLTETAVNTLVRNSKMSAKVDSALVQDGYQLYHHTFFFSINGAWAVVQQGMNVESSSARRYHWFDKLEIKDHPFGSAQGKRATGRNETINFVSDPHQGIASQTFEPEVLNMVSTNSSKTQETAVDLLQAGYKQLRRDFELLKKYKSSTSKVLSVRSDGEIYTAAEFSRQDFHHNPVELESFAESKYLDKMLKKLDEIKPKTYEEFVSSPGVGPKTVRALALTSEVIYGAAPSYEDPARYAFAHGGKDAIPYPVDRETYDQTIETVRKAVRKSKLSPVEKDQALYRLV